MLNGLDLFSGIGGLTVALSEWVRPVAYCENERFAQGVLLSRIQDGRIPVAPIWDDVRTLRAKLLCSSEIDIIYGGFPCQDISVAGNGAGLEGERSGLFFQILRLVDEIKPPFIFLENVPAIRTRGAERVVKELSSRGYDCRWDVVSAAEVGAPHLRKRWFLLAYASGTRLSTFGNQGGLLEAEGGGASAIIERGSSTPLADAECIRRNGRTGDLAESNGRTESTDGSSDYDDEYSCGCIGECSCISEVVNPAGIGRSEGRPEHEIRNGWNSPATDASWWSIEPNVGRVANGVPQRVDRIKGLGNAVVPLQAREAFKRLMGLEVA